MGRTVLYVLCCSGVGRERKKRCPLITQICYLPFSNPCVFHWQCGTSNFSNFFLPPFFFFFGIDLFYTKSAFHLTFKIEVSMVQQLPKPLPSCNYGTLLHVCLATKLRQEVLQIYCSCFFIDCQQLQLLEFESHKYSKETLRAD